MMLPTALGLAIALACTVAAARPGAYTDLGGGWDGTASIAALDGKLHVINKGTLYATSLGASWDNVAGVTSLDGRLYIVSRGKLFSADVK